MHARLAPTRRVLFPLVLFIVVLVAFDVSAKPLASRKTGKNSNHHEENLLSQTNKKRAEASTEDEDTYVYRCGQETKAFYSHAYRKRRYIVTPFKITNKMVINWSVKVYSNKLTQNEQLNVFTAAFKEWDDVTTVNFSYVSNPSQADIVISFTTTGFDGPSGMLAHAYYYTSTNTSPGHIYFDEDEHWVTSNTGAAFEANLLAVALHEIGHAVGITHSTVSQSVMHSTISNTKTKLHEDDIKAIRWLYGKCEVKDITAVMHDRYFDGSDTVLVLNKNKVYRLSVHDGFLYQESNEKWPKDTRDYFRVTDSMYDKVFPLRAAVFVYGYRDMHLMGQRHFVRKRPVFDPRMTKGRYYEFKDKMIYNLADIWGPLIPEGPLPYTPMNTDNTPDFFKDFLTTNAKFGAAYQYTSTQHWLHYFLNGTHYKVSPHSVTNYHIEDMSVNFPGAPQNPDATWYDNKNFEWYFFKGDKYYKLDTSTQQYTDRGPISLLWHSPCD